MNFTPEGKDFNLQWEGWFKESQAYCDAMADVGEAQQDFALAERDYLCDPFPDLGTLERIGQICSEHRDKFRPGELDRITNELKTIYHRYFPPST